jgi:hypothetical protein
MSVGRSSRRRWREKVEEERMKKRLEPESSGGLEVLLGFSTASRLWGLTTRERKIGLSLKLKIAARLG